MDKQASNPNIMNNDHEQPRDRSETQLRLKPPPPPPTTTKKKTERGKTTFLLVHAEYEDGFISSNTNEFVD
jgi:hypothetical protein